MTKRTIEIEDNLDEIIESCQDDLKVMLNEYLDDTPDLDETPDLSNDLDYDGRFHELIDGAVPIYTKEINDLWYLYGDDFEESFDNAGIGEKSDELWPSGWKAAAIYCYLEEKMFTWYSENADDIFEEWKEKHPAIEDVE